MFKNGKWCCCKVQFLLSTFILLNAQLNVAKNSAFFSEARNLTKFSGKTRFPYYKTVNSGLTTNFPPLILNKNVAAVLNETLLNSLRLKREHEFGTILNQTSENYNSASDNDNESSSDEQDPLPPETFGFAGAKEITPIEKIGRSNPRMYKEKIERRPHLFLWDKIGRNYQQQLHNHNIGASASKNISYDVRPVAPKSPKIISLKGLPPIKHQPSSLVNSEKLGDTSKFNTIEKLSFPSAVDHVHPKIIASTEKLGESFILIKRVPHDDKIAPPANLITKQSSSRTIGKSDYFPTTTYDEEVGNVENTLSIIGMEKLPKTQHAVHNLTQERIGKSKPNYLHFQNQSVPLLNTTRLPHGMDQFGKENQNMSLMHKDAEARGHVQLLLTIRFKQEIIPANSPKITTKLEKLRESSLLLKRVPHEKIATTSNFIDDLSPTRPIGKSNNLSTTTYNEEVGKFENKIPIMGMHTLPHTLLAVSNLTQERIGQSKLNYLVFPMQNIALSNALRFPHGIEQFGEENQNILLLQKEALARGQVQPPILFKQEIVPPADYPKVTAKVEKQGESLMLIKRFPNQAIASPANLMADQPYNSAVGKHEKISLSAQHEKVGKSKNTLSIEGIELLPQTQKIVPNLTQQEIGQSKLNYLEFLKQNIALSNVIRLPLVIEQLGKEYSNLSLVQKDARARIKEQVQRPLFFKQNIALSQHPMSILNQEKFGRFPTNHGAIIKQEIGTLNNTNVYVPDNRVGHSGMQYFVSAKQGIGQAFRKYPNTLNPKTGDLKYSQSISPQEIGKYTNLVSRPPEKIGQWISKQIPLLQEMSPSQPDNQKFISPTEQLGQSSHNFSAMTSTGFGKLNYTFDALTKEKRGLQNQLLRISKKHIGQSHHKPENLTQNYQGIGQLREQLLGIPTEEVGKLQDLLPTFSREEVGTVAQIVPYIQRNRIGALAQLLITLKKAKNKFGNLTQIFKSLSRVKIAKLGPPSVIREKIGPQILPIVPNGKLIGASAYSLITKTGKLGVNIPTFVEDKGALSELNGYTSVATTQKMYITPIPDLHPLQDPILKHTSPHYVNSFPTTVLKEMPVTNFAQTNQIKTSVILQDNSSGNFQHLAAVTTVTESSLAKSKSTQFQSTSATPSTPSYSYSTSQQQLLPTVPSPAVKSELNSRLPNTSKNHTAISLGVKEKRRKKRKKILPQNNTAAPSRLTTARRQRKCNLKSSKRVSLSNKSLLQRLVEELKVVWDNAWTILKV